MAEATLVFTGTRAKSPGRKTDWTSAQTVAEGTRAASKKDEGVEAFGGDEVDGAAAVESPSDPQPTRRMRAAMRYRYRTDLLLIWIPM